MGSRNAGTLNISRLLFTFQKNISHLLFADDTLMFCGGNLDHLRNLCCLFLCFEAVLGLIINLAKSELVPIGNVNNVEGLTNILDCRVASLPLKSLDLALGSLFRPNLFGALLRR